MTISNTFLISICKISLIDKNHYIIDSSMTKEVCKRIRAKFSVCIEKEKFDSIQTQANRIKRFYNIWMHIRQTKFKKTQNVNLKLPKRILICITGHCIVMFPRSSYHGYFSLVILYYHLIILTYKHRDTYILNSLNDIYNLQDEKGIIKLISIIRQYSLITYSDHCYEMRFLRRKLHLFFSLFLTRIES